MGTCCADLGACTGCGTKDEPRSPAGRCAACIAARIKPHTWCGGCDQQAVALRVNVPQEPVLEDYDDADDQWERYQDEGRYPPWM